MLPRKLLKILEAQSRDRKASLLLGARQVGKTTLLKALYERLSLKNRCLFLDLDILSNYEKVSTFEGLLQTLKLRGYEQDQKELFYLFLDEFQKYPVMAGIMKNTYDHLPNVKIYASGSSSLTMKNQIQESLAGRKKINELFPLDFEEFLIFKHEDALAKNLRNIARLKGEDLSPQLREYHELLKEFLIFGGYPEVALKRTMEEKREVLESIFDLYVKKDLVEYLNIGKVLEMKKLIEFLAVNNGQKTKYEEISSLTSLKFQEIKRYMEILEETYLIEVLRPFYTNKNKELVKIPKIYFSDCGVRNYFVRNFNELSLRDDAGFLFETFILSELIKQGKRDLRFWQDKRGNEVDFVLQKEQHLFALEAKWKTKLKTEDCRGLQAFSDSYTQVRRKYICSKGMQKAVRNTIMILPFSLTSVGT